MNNIKKIHFLLPKKYFLKANLLLVFILVTAIFDVAGIASIFPFIMVLSNPEVVETNVYLNYFFKFSSVFGVITIEQFINLIGIIFFFILVVSIFLRGLFTYFNTRFTNLCEYSMSSMVVENYMQQPYSWFLNRNSASLIRTILSEVSLIIGGILMPIINIISQSIITFFIIILLFFADPTVTAIIFFTLGTLYLLIYIFSKTYLVKIGGIRTKSNHVRYKSITEAFGSIKELKLSGLESKYSSIFSNSAKFFAKTNAANTILSAFPRFILEAIVFGGAILLILILSSHTKNFQDTLPLISLYVFSGYRILPLLQQLYSNFTSVKYYQSSLDELYNDIKSLKKKKIKQEKSLTSFNKNIELKKINFTYPKSTKAVLKDINISIPINSSLGIVGSTGSGKTTLVDIILGLLNPDNDSGQILVDGHIIDENYLKSWQSFIGYVPQQIYLTDDSIAKNIVFGNENLDLDQVEKVSKIAQLHDFVVSELPKKYETIVGERGVKLSGGQRQRIGIARALYNHPKLLVLDEATSALDSITEYKIMKSIRSIGINITTILIAHRLNTIKNCDNIILLEKGKLAGQGNFEKLKKTNTVFNEMTKLNE